MSIPDMYGPGVAMHTNSRGFRNTEEFTTHVPPGKFRIICSGDSFTLGYGVSDYDTWCQRLALMDSRIQTVNMGQGGYGVDQAYLWYMREGMKFDHQVLIFAFIYADFPRMMYTRFFGHGKPRLVLERDRLLVRNVPVPKHRSLASRLGLDLSALSQLRVVGHASSVLRRATGSSAPAGEWHEKELEARPLALKVFEQLRDTAQQRHRILVLVYLPAQEDCFGSAQYADLRRFLREEGAKRNLCFWDLTNDFQHLPAGEIRSLYFNPSQISASLAAGHYTPEGNRHVAEFLYRRIAATLPVHPVKP